MKTKKQRDTMDPARQAASYWKIKFETLQNDIYSMTAWGDENFRKRFEIQLEETDKRRFKPKKKCMLCFLIKYVGNDVITPLDFLETSNSETFCGWTGFWIREGRSLEFKNALDEIFSRIDGSACQEKTVRAFFRSEACMMASKWDLGLQGKVPFVLVHKVWQHPFSVPFLRSGVIFFVSSNRNRNYQH
jgi:hypothetical protein